MFRRSRKAKENRKIIIGVKTDLHDDPQTKEFEVLVPSNIVGYHSGFRVKGLPRDGLEDRNLLGASMCVILILEPLSVNFNGLELIEKANDEKLPERVPPHVPRKEPAKIGTRNHFQYDEVGFYYPGRVR